MKIRFSEKLWAILGTWVAILALVFSAYTFYQSSKLVERTLISGLVLDAHEAVYDFLAQVNQHKKTSRTSSESGEDPIHPEFA